MDIIIVLSSVSTVVSFVFISGWAICLLDSKKKHTRIQTFFRKTGVAVIALYSFSFSVIGWMSVFADNHNEINIQSKDYKNTYEEISEEAYKKGYTDGYNEGHSDGFNLNNKSSYESGYNEGLSAGYSSDKTDAYNKGYDDGYNNGYDDGAYDTYREMENSFDEGYEEGYAAGQNSAS